jgi:hypothetical protein
MKGLLEPEMRSRVEAFNPDLMRYLERMVADGVDTTRHTDKTRVQARPYGSALEHMPEMWQRIWKDVRHGAVLLTSAAVAAPFLDAEAAVEAPLGRVPKQNPDRTLSSEGRPIHAMLAANALTHKFAHPPALQPKHKQLVRRALWWKQRHPGIRVVCSKRDVAHLNR